MNARPTAWHATPELDVAAALDAGPDGLSSADAQARLSRFGPNRLPEAAGPSAARLLLDQVRTPLMWALLAAGGLALALGELEDGLVVLAVVVLNALIGFAQEYRAGRAIAALAELVAEPARVRRDGAWVEIPAEQVVPGRPARGRAGRPRGGGPAAARRGGAARAGGRADRRVRAGRQGRRRGRRRRAAGRAPQPAVRRHRGGRGQRPRRDRGDRPGAPSWGASRRCSRASSRWRRRSRATSPASDA